jgi:hypothetical protein
VYSSHVCWLVRSLHCPLLGSLAGELMFLQHALVVLQEYKHHEKLHRVSVVSKVSSSSGSARKRSRSRSPARSTHHDVAFFHAPVFGAIWSNMLGDIAAQLATGARSEGAESEWLRFALLVRRTAEAALSSSFAELKQRTQELATNIPQLPVPLTLRPAVQERAPGVTHLAQLWTSHNAAVKQVHLERMLVEFEGDLAVRGRGATEGEEEDDAEDVVEPAPAVAESKSDVQAPSKRSKKSSKSSVAASDTAPTASPTDQFDSFGSARGSALFFLDSSGLGSVVPGAGDASADADQSEEHEVGRSMTKILGSIQPQAAMAKAAKKEKTPEEKRAEKQKAKDKEKKAKAKAKGKKAGQEEAEQVEEPQEPDEDDDMGQEADAPAADAEDVAPMDVDDEADESEAAPAPVKEEAIAAKSAKKISSRVKKEPKTAAAATETATRSKRATKKKLVDDEE